MGRRGGTLLAAATATVLGIAVVMAGASAGIWPELPGMGDLLELPSAFEPSGQPDDLVPDGSVPPPMLVGDLYAAFSTPGATARSYGAPVTLSSAPAGSVVLPSGRLVAADGMVVTGAEPFTTTVPPGVHPVTVLTADWPDDGDHRVAAAMVRVAEGEPLTWEPALLVDQDPATLGPDEGFGYGVDSGSGAFMGPEAVAALEDEDAYQAYSDEAFATMYPDDGTVVDSAAVVVDPASGANVVTFPSGFGDGLYSTWVGLDADGRPVVFVTDFWVLDAG